MRCDSSTKLLYVVGLVYCGNQLTDGFIPMDTLPLLAGMAGIDLANAKQNVSKLCSVGLWNAVDDMWHIPDYLEYNPSREQVLHKKAVRKAAGRAGGLANAKANAKQNASKIVPPSPSPSPSERDEGLVRPPTTPPPDPFPKSDPEWGAAITKLESAGIGGMSGEALLELSALWPDLTNGKRAWLDDAILVAIANGAKSPVYALRVLAGAVRENRRPGTAPVRKPKGGRVLAGQSGRSIAEIIGLTAAEEEERNGITNDRFAAA